MSDSWPTLMIFDDVQKANWARTELIGAGPELYKSQCHSRFYSIHSPVAHGRYRRMSSKYIVPEPPDTPTLAFVPRPIANLSTLVRLIP